MRSKSLERLGVGNGWAQEGAMAVLGLLLGFAVLPLLIYFAGSTLLGRYDDATPARIYDGVYQGLQLGSPASFVVVFGPYGLYLAYKALRLWWRAGARTA